MTKYKLNISFTVDTDDLAEVLKGSKEILKGDVGFRYLNPDVSLTREGDRSSANLLAPINDKHYKHGKVPLSEIKLD